MTDKDFQEMQEALKRGHLIVAIAKSEIEKNMVFSEAGLKEAIKKAGLTKEIKRVEIDFQKALLQDEEYQALSIEIDSLLDSMTKSTEKEEYKEKIIKLLESRDKIFSEIRRKYDF